VSNYPIEPLDPFTAVWRLIGEFPPPAPVDAAQLAAATALVAGALAALGHAVSVDGNAQHPRIADGLAALEVVRRRQHGRPGGAR
jgi:hypothetical protein